MSAVPFGIKKPENCHNNADTLEPDEGLLARDQVLLPVLADG